MDYLAPNGLTNKAGRAILRSVDCLHNSFTFPPRSAPPKKKPRSLAAKREEAARIAERIARAGKEAEWLTIFVRWAKGDPKLTCWEENFLTSVGQQVARGTYLISDKQATIIQELRERLGYDQDAPVVIPDEFPPEVDEDDPDVIEARAEQMALLLIEQEEEEADIEGVFARRFGVRLRCPEQRQVDAPRLPVASSGD